MHRPVDRRSNIGDPGSREFLHQLLFGFYASQLIIVAAQLRLADLLRNGPISSEDLAKSTATHAPALHRVLRGLACIGVLYEIEPGCFELSPLGEPLLTDAPESMRSLVMLYGGEEVWRSWGNLLECIKSGETAFEQLYGVTHFGWVEQNPSSSAAFNDLWGDTTGQIAPAILAAYDFSVFRLVVDVGGGNGTLIGAILKANPGQHGVLFDTASGVSEAQTILAAAGVTDRCEVVAGDFLQSVPPGGDLYILKNVVDDLDDARIVEVLKNCRHAMVEDAKVLMVEPVLPPRIERPGASVGLVMSDLNMLVCCGGRRRTETEFNTLLGAGGFQLRRIVPVPSADLSVIEATPNPSLAL
jgi:hypothetical protein